MLFKYTNFIFFLYLSLLTEKDTYDASWCYKKKIHILDYLVLFHIKNTILLEDVSIKQLQMGPRFVLKYEQSFISIQIHLFLASFQKLLLLWSCLQL